MYKKSSLLRHVSSICILAVTPSANALSFLTFDARAMALGGSGIAYADPGSAALMNPALMVSDNPNLHNTYFAHLYAGARLIDRDDFIDRIEILEEEHAEEAVDELLAKAKQAFSAGTLTGAELLALSDQADKLLTDVIDLSDRPLRASGAYGFAGGYVRESLAMGLYSRNYLVLGASLQLAPIDVERMQQLISVSRAIADVMLINEDIQALADTLDSETINSLVQESLEQGSVAPPCTTMPTFQGSTPLLNLSKIFNQTQKSCWI